VQREQDLARLAPKRGLIPAQPIKGIGRQVGQADKGACEIVGRICTVYWARIKVAANGLIVIQSLVLLGREGVSVHAVDDLLAVLMSLSPPPKLKQVFRLDSEQAALDSGGATQPP
jgi:hypothetical protein